MVLKILQITNNFNSVRYDQVTKHLIKVKSLNNKLVKTQSIDPENCRH